MIALKYGFRMKKAKKTKTKALLTHKQDSASASLLQRTVRRYKLFLVHCQNRQKYVVKMKNETRTKHVPRIKALRNVSRPRCPMWGGSEASLHRHSRTCSGHHQHGATTAHGLIV